MNRHGALLGFLGRDGALSKIHELVREMRVARVMTTALLTLTPNNTMQELKELLRKHRISGVPVVEDGKLVGIASIEDLIHALEEHRLNAPIREYMTREGLITAHAQEPVMEALRRFEKTGIGRMPVLDGRGKLVGIITRGDITVALLRALQELYSEAEAAQSRPRRCFEALESDRTRLKLRYRVRKGDFTHGGEASSKIKRALLYVGASPQLARRVAIATYEAEINLIIHTDDGGLILANVQPDTITITAQDTGPGIPDVELARQPGYSTAPPEIRELGFGAGMGLTNIERCADKVSLWSAVGIGTCLQMWFRIAPETDTEGQASEEAERQPPEG